MLPAPRTLTGVRGGSCGSLRGMVSAIRSVQREVSRAPLTLLLELVGKSS
jgi:hypothetical protein